MFKLLPVAALAAAAAAQLYSPGVQVLTFLSDADDSDQPYALYLPARMEQGRRYPLVISLHGAGSNHRLNLRQLFGRGPGMVSEQDGLRGRNALPDVPFIAAAPLARGSMGYQGIAERDVYQVLEDVKRRFAIDDDRVYLTGLSMGGGGALWLGLTRPDVWAAVAAVCPSAPPLDGLYGNAANFPVRLFQGEADPIVPAETTRQLHQALRDAGVPVEYVEYPGIRHNAWDVAYRDAAIFEWFGRHRRQRFPKRVRFATREYDYASAWWLRLDGLTPGTPAVVDARLDGPNQVVVATGGIDGFTLRLAGHPEVAPLRPVRVNVDGTPFTRKFAEALSFRRRGGVWAAGLYTPVAPEKRPGQSGPARQVIAGRHLYIYGTLDNPGPEETERRRQQAVQASEWSTPRARLLVDWPVLADSEVQPQQLGAANLVLFGTRHTNSVIARLDLPLELNPSSADYGLVQVVPAGGRVAVVSSGLPWWTRADQASRPGLGGIAPPWRSLAGFGDYVLFKGGLDTILAEGRFDRQWRLPSNAAAAIARTGVVTIR